MPVIGEGKKTSRYQYSLKSRTGLGGGGDRDFIQTPAIAVKLLLEVEKFNGLIWEPMCGRGAISKILTAAGLEVSSTDLVDRGFGKPGVDFFKCTDKAANLITNPPYSVFPEFITKAHSLYERKMAYFCLWRRWGAVSGASLLSMPSLRSRSTASLKECHTSTILTRRSLRLSRICGWCGTRRSPSLKDSLRSCCG